MFIAIFDGSICHIFFNETFKAKKTDFGLWNTERISLFANSKNLVG